MTHSVDRLKEIMVRLRDPNGGCPWDVEQTFATIAPYTIEEAYEVADAIERADMEELKVELGDLRTRARRAFERATSPAGDGDSEPPRSIS